MSYEETKAEEYWSKRVIETDQLAAVLSYNLPSYFNEAYSTWEIACVLDSVPAWEGLEVLDIGCGVGRVTVPVAKAGAKVTAFDNSHTMLELCQKNVSEAGVLERVKFQHGSARQIPAKDGQFDVALCLGVLEHLPPDVRSAALAEVTRVIKPGGTAVVVVNSTTSAFLSREQRYRSEAQEPTGYHVSLIGMDHVRQHFEGHGFTVENLGSNLFQSLTKHVLKTFLPIQSGQDALSALLETCAQLDLSFRNKGDLDTAFADQYVLRATRSRLSRDQG
jgi:2-polyprenyl-3-methyl-5-hydroxy-6-metoxy-1,4-benzoquinol methylase